MAQLVGNDARGKPRLVQDSGRRLPERVAGDPGELLVSARVPEVTSDVGRVAEAAQRVREERLIKARAGHEPGPQHARGQRRQLEQPLSTLPRSKSTCDQITASASPIRQPVASM